MVPYRFDAVSLVPKAFEALNGLGVIGRAFSKKIAELHIHNPRDFALDRYHKVDDEPYGGGAGMLLKPEPVFAAFESIPLSARSRVVMLTPQGKSLSQNDFRRWAQENDQLILPRLYTDIYTFYQRKRETCFEEVPMKYMILLLRGI